MSGVPEMVGRKRKMINNGVASTEAGSSKVLKHLPLRITRCLTLVSIWKDIFCSKKKNGIVHCDKTISFLAASPLMSGLKYEVIRGY